jgi:beta-galactosidase
MERKLVASLYGDLSIEVLDLPPYVFVEWRDGFWVAVNYASEEVVIPVTEGDQILFGEKSIKPGGVTVWVED